MAQNIDLLGAQYPAVPSVLLPKVGGGTAAFTDVSDTTATAEDVAEGTYFYTAAGVRTAGTASGGGGGVETASVTIAYASVYYTDATMTPQTGDRCYGVQMPVGSICVGRGAADPATPTSGITPIASWGSRTTAVHVYKVTG